MASFSAMCPILNPWKMQRVSGPCFDSKAILSIFYLFIGSSVGRAGILQNPINSLSS
jgi:hypothetical protein